MNDRLHKSIYGQTLDEMKENKGAWEYKQEPSGDFISRQAALGCCRNEWEEEVEIRLKSLPPVNPQPNCPYYVIDDDGHGLCKNHRVLEQEPKSPCDLCRYNPPSSADGKPCTMCPAQAIDQSKVGRWIRVDKEGTK